jgi:DNA-binding transcriptional LysR family regulator
MLRDHLARGTLEPVLTDVSTEAVEVHAVWPRQAHPSPRVRHVIDRLLAEAASGTLG